MFKATGCGVVCTNCGNMIHNYSRYLRIGSEVLCEWCIDNLTEEYDPEGDYADEVYELSKGW